MIYTIYSIIQQKTKIDSEYKGEEELSYLNTFRNYLIKFNYVPEHDLFELIEKICNLESKAFGLIQRKNETPINFPEVLNQNDEYTLEFETLSKKTRIT